MAEPALNLNDVFKFKIGDVVRHRISGMAEDPPEGERTRYFSSSTDRKTRFIILERILQECHGGIQRNYNCRAVGSEGQMADKCINASELELVACTPFEYPPLLPKDEAKK